MLMVLNSTGFCACATPGIAAHATTASIRAQTFGIIVERRQATTS
jgi:hypothetical protein